MSPGKALRGLTVLVTRPQEEARDLIGRLRAAGARVIPAPAVRVLPPSTHRALDAALKHLGTFDAVVFTSANGVESFFTRARALGLGPMKRPRRLYAVGPRTARALKEHGWGRARVPAESGGAALARAMGRVSGWRILLPRAREGHPELPRRLKEAGAKLSLVEAYRTAPEGRSDSLLRRAASSGTVDAVAFASGSAVRALIAGIGLPAARRLFSRAGAASIGPSTSKTLRSFGIRPAVEAESATSAALARAITGLLSRGEAK